MKQLSLFSGTEHAAPDEYPDDGFNGFLIFHRGNPEIYQIFKNVAFKHIYEQRTEKMGARGIIDGIRWDLEESGRGHVKISNNHIAYYTRIFQREYPEHARIFDIRPLKNQANEIALTEIK